MNYLRDRANKSFETSMRLIANKKEVFSTEIRYGKLYLISVLFNQHSI